MSRDRRLKFKTLRAMSAEEISRLSAANVAGLSARKLMRLDHEQRHAVTQLHVSSAVLDAEPQQGGLGILEPTMRWIEGGWLRLRNKERVRRRPKKLEDFDFHELTSGMANSVTDQLYREMMPSVGARYAKQVAGDPDLAIQHLENDLDVHSIVKDVRKDVDGRLKQAVAKAITYRVIQEFEEQYHPKPGSGTAVLDTALKWFRYIMVIGYVMAFLVLFSVTFLAAYKSGDLAFQTFDYIAHGITAKIEKHEIDYVAEQQAFNALIGGTLKVADLLLIGTLLVMVIIGGFENTIGRIGMSHDTPTWFGKLGIAELKIRVAASIVIISSVHLLMTFMTMGMSTPLTDQQIKSAAAITIIHIVFVVSALILAGIIRLTEPHHRTLADKFGGEDKSAPTAGAGGH